MSYEVKDVLAELFQNAAAVMEELDAGTDEFTYHDFLHTVTQRNQPAYIELLYRCRERDAPVNAANQHFGARLAHLAGQAGYTRIETNGYVDDMFGNKTTQVIIYRKQG